MSDTLGFRIRAEPWLFSLSIVGATLGVMFILDYPELPLTESALTTSHLFSLFNGVPVTFLSMGYVGIFVLMFLENMALTIPSEVVLPFTGYLVRTGTLNFPVALIVSTIASLLGSLVIYFLARKLSPPLLHKLTRVAGISDERLKKTEAWVSGKYGTFLVLVARFVPGIRSSIAIPAGILRMSTLRFSLTTLVGSFGWSLLLIYAGYSASSFLTRFVSHLLYLAPYTLTIACLGYCAYFIGKRLIAKSRRSSFILVH
jgi:membrane protein DedA with SNARE-associated domain